jgi:hypothetical protein
MKHHYVYSRDTKLYIKMKNLTNSGEQKHLLRSCLWKIFTLYGIRYYLVQISTPMDPAQAR